MLDTPTTTEPINPDDWDVVIPVPGAGKPMPWLATLASARIPYRLEPALEPTPDRRWELLVPTRFAVPAQRELAHYLRLNQNWPPPRPQPVASPLLNPDAVSMSLIMATALLAFFLVLGPFDAHRPAMAAADASADRIRAGEWWRCITSLTLHADLAHVSGNAICAVVFGQALCRSLGSGLGWVVILLAGGYGNLAAAYFGDAGRAAVGASTATFGALGVLGVFQFRRHYAGWRDLRSVWSRAWIPVMAALGALGVLGTSPQADLYGHGCGFLCGMALGGLLLPLMDKLLPAWLQVTMGLLFFTLLAACWRLAVHA